jgi:hypothetical protein
VGQALRSGLVPLLLTLVVSGAAIGVLLAVLKDQRWLLMGAEYRKIAIPPTFDTTLKTLGFGFFPWFALLPVALGAFVVAQGRSARERGRDAFLKMLLLVLIAGGYVLASVWEGYFSKVRFPAQPWMAVAVGVLLYEISVSKLPVRRLWALLAVGLVLVLHQDFFMAPESLAFSHMLEHAKYPIELNIKVPVRVFGVVMSVLLFFAFGGMPRVVIPKTLGQQLGRVALFGMLASAVAFAGWLSFYLMPQLSLHMSNKALFSTFHRCKTGGEMLAQYQVPGRGAAYYNDGQVKEIRDMNELFSLLREDQRWFVLVPAHQLAPIDQSARQQNLVYHVLDDRSSQYLMLSNKLVKPCDTDHNPLRRFVVSEEPKPQKPIKANFENKVELLGYDVDDVVTRGGKFPITLYFKVLGQMPSGYKVFIHFDQPANRFHGDHVPLGGKYPTEYWLPGDYIIDRHEVEIPIITTPSGRYTMYMGFWLGSERLKVIEGPNDGVNRVNIGTLRVR